MIDLLKLKQWRSEVSQCFVCRYYYCFSCYYLRQRRTLRFRLHLWIKMVGFLVGQLSVRLFTEEFLTDFNDLQVCWDPANRIRVWIQDPNMECITNLIRDVEWICLCVHFLIKMQSTYVFRKWIFGRWLRSALSEGFLVIIFIVVLALFSFWH